jgi:trk system potassium uptake protein TrkA
MRIIIVGCGRVGSGLARTLAMRGHAITVVDNNPAAFERLGPGFEGKTVTGVGFDREVLLKAGVKQADGFAAVTTSDEMNVVAARLAQREFRVPRVAARVYEPGKAEIYRQLGLQTISPVSLGIHQLADMLSYSPMNVVANLGHGDIDLVEIEISPMLAMRKVRDITIPGEAHVVAIYRRGRSFLPGADTTFEAGDLVQMAVMSASSERLKGMLGLD